MSEVATVALSIDEARTLTDEVKADAAALWAKLLTLYEGGAHKALGYSSWGDYYAEEFGDSKRRGYQLLEAARVVDAIEPVQDFALPASDSVARELAPVLRDDPEEVPVVWGEVVEEHGDNPTAADVREVVERHVPPRKTNQQHNVVSGIAEKARRITELEHHIDLEAIASLPEEEKAEWKLQLSAARTVLSRVIAAL